MQKALKLKSHLQKIQIREVKEREWETYLIYDDHASDAGDKVAEVFGM